MCGSKTSARASALPGHPTRLPSGLVRFFCALSCLFAAHLSGCKRPPSPAADDAPPQILRLSQRNEPADLDPARATLPDEYFIIRALAEGLVVPAPTPLPIQNQASRILNPPVLPAAALRWEISADALTYTFHLRPGARWSNGEPVTAADFVASYRRALTPATLSPKADLFYPVKNARAHATGALTDFAAVGFRAADPLTLVVTLERPTAAFLLYAASGPWIPVNPRVVTRHGRAWTRPENHVGNGPFTLAEWTPHQRIVVKKNPAHPDAARVRLSEIHFLAFDNRDAEERAYRAGQIDVTMDVPIPKLATYARERPAELHRAPLAETRYLTFNTRRPPLDDPRVRRALSLAIDREKIVTHVLRGGQQPANRFLPPSLSAPPASDVLPPTSGGAAAEAAALLAAAGFPDGKNFPRLELTGWSQTPVLEAIQAMWKQTLGIEVTLAVREAKVHVAALRAGTYDLGFITEIPDVADPAPTLANFATDAPGNYPHWSDPRFDALLATDPAAAERLLLEAAPVAPLYFNAKNWLMSPRVRSWQEDPLWTRRYLETHLGE